MKTFFSILLIAVIASSCEKTINFKIPQEEDKITIDCKLFTDQNIVALVGTSAYSLGTADPKTDVNSRVLLYENNILIDTLTPDKSQPGLYSSPIIPAEQNSYTVEALREGFKTASGTEYLRNSVAINLVELDTVHQKVTISFKDPAGMGDYYYISLSSTRSSGDKNLYPLETHDPIIEMFDSYSDPFEQDNNKKTGLQCFLSDRYFDGKTKQVTFENLSYINNGGNYPFYLNLYRVSKDYYDHIRTKEAQRQTDEIFSEPVQIYTNITNGYGIVAGGSASRVQISRW